MLKKLMFLMALLVVGGGALFAWLYLQHWRTAHEAEQRHQETAAAYEQITAFQQANPDLKEEIIRRLETFIETYSDSEEALLARARIDEFRQADEQMRREAERVFKDNVEQLIASGQYDEAAVYVEQYSGPYADELKAERDETLRDIRQRIRQRQKADAERTQAAQAELENVMNKTAEALYHFRFKEAQDTLNKAMNNPVLAPELSALQAFATDAEAVCAMPRQICYSFLENMDAPVSVSLRSGEKIVRINDVEDTRVLADRILFSGGNEVGSTPDPFTFEELSLREMAARVSKEKNDENFTMIALLFIQAKQYEKARTALKSVATPLGPLLTEWIDTNSASDAGTPPRRPVTNPVFEPDAQHKLIRL